MIVTPATSWVSHRYTFGWLVELRRCCSTGPACHGQLEYTKHITLYLHWYCVYLHTFYICTYPHMHMGICIYIILCTCHMSMLYRYVGMCDKHERSIHMLSMLYKPKNSLVRAHAFCWEAHWVTSQYACHSSMPGGHNFFRNDSNHMSSSMVHILGIGLWVESQSSTTHW